MFSPYYAWSKWRDPENHCAMNVALYRAGSDRWAMTERGRPSLARDTNSIAIGPSNMHWDGDALRIDIDEWTAPIPSRVRGTVTIHPEALAQVTYYLDEAARHLWRPIAPRARAEVRFDDGGLSWGGDAYVDCNCGAEPLEYGFRAWDWSRARTRDGAVVYYNVTTRAGAARTLSLQFDKTGDAATIEAPSHSRLPATFWRLPRRARGAPRLVRTLEDAPFYARSHLIDDIDGERAHIIHESLSLDRFRSPIVRAMLPFRMPRIIGRR